MFGPPGVGKGTHARRLAGDLGVPHISTGDMLRRAIAEDSDLGRRAASHMNHGALVPDEVAVAILEERLASPDANVGYLLDGFPRTVGQAEVFDHRLSGGPQPTDVVLALEAPEEVLVQRLAGRQTCSACGATFNPATRPTQVPDVCDACGAPLLRRSDDEAGTIRRRLEAYRRATAPVLSHLEQHGWPVRRVASVGGIEEVYGRIKTAAVGKPGGV